MTIHLLGVGSLTVMREAWTVAEVRAVFPPRIFTLPGRFWFGEIDLDGKESEA